jgi:protein gp37
MNKTGVEYADYSWNPITGCFGTNGELCAYCYAKGTARRFAARVRDGGTEVRGKACEEGKIHVLDEPYCEWALMRSDIGGNKLVYSPYPYGFDPTFHKYRLAGDKSPASVKKPSVIFVGDMADMFGPWVPDIWLEDVIAACAAAPKHRYLFLTKHAKGYDRLYYLLDMEYCDRDARDDSNYFFGFTATNQSEFNFRADDVDMYVTPQYRAFASLEPLCGPIELDGVGRNGIEWIIVGADTSNRKNKIIPKKEWIERIVDDCKRNGVPVFLKDNLRDIWGAGLIQEYPEGLR